MITYQNASRCPEAFRGLFGCSVAEFDALYAAFAAAHAQRLAQSVLTRKKATPRKRKPGAGRRFKHALRDRLLLALFWLRVYPTLELLGFFFSLDRTSAEDNLKDVLATLSTLACFTPEHPDRRRRKLRTLEQMLDAFPDMALLMDVRQSSMQTPGDTKKPTSSEGSEGSEMSAEPGPEAPEPSSASGKPGGSLTSRLLPHKFYCTASHLLLTTGLPLYGSADETLSARFRGGDAAGA